MINCRFEDTDQEIYFNILHDLETLNYLLQIPIHKRESDYYLKVDLYRTLLIKAGVLKGKDANANS